MIVEDNELNMKLFSDLLQSNGYDTVQVKDGRDVLATVRQHIPDLIVMDIQLPGVSGLDITKMIKTDDQLKDIPVIAVTAFAMKGDEGNIRQAGCDAYISKPISVPIFMETITTFLD
jgi:two-component system cell cycle response regulator DivK